MMVRILLCIAALAVACILATLVYDAHGAAIDPMAPAEYTAAYKASLQTHRPLLVLFGAEWCVPCRQIHNDRACMAALRSRGHFAYIDIDRHRQYIDRYRLIERNGPIPRLLVWTWERGRFVPRAILGAAAIRAYLFPPLIIKVHP